MPRFNVEKNPDIIKSDIYFYEQIVAKNKPMATIRERENTRLAKNKITKLKKQLEFITGVKLPENCKEISLNIIEEWDC